MQTPTLGGKVFSNTFFHSSKGVFARIFPISPSEVGGGPKDFSTAQNNTSMLLLQDELPNHFG